ncbi:hypothetical protein FACS189434_02970 [Bacteroidia bacterium]|nr:hypothetical protein FACS189434_02970 [Bacteroidia bacterium]
MKSAIGMCAKNEHKYIQECICFNYLQGWDKIIICLHDVPNESETDLTKEMIYKLPDEVLAKVKLLDVEEESGWGYQHKGYHLMLQETMDYDWLALFDVDEYLYDSQKRPINELLTTISSDVGQILIPWLEYGHNNRVLSATSQETRLSAFTKTAGIDLHANHKTIIRPRSVIQKPDEPRPSNYWYHTHQMITRGRHTDFFNHDIVPLDFDFDGEDMPKRFYFSRKDFTAFDVCLIHYYTGSMEDWVIRTKRTALTSAASLPRTFQTFFDMKYNKEDGRMSIYVDELRELLSKCKQ